MPSVVFTGQAIDAAGNMILRADLAAAAKKAGWAVWDVVKPGITVLVSSRTDTVKAKDAAKIGIQVVTYPDFLKYLAAAGEQPVLASESKLLANAYTDPEALAQAVSLTAAQKREAAVAPFRSQGKWL